MNDIAAENPDIVASMRVALEAALDGPGSIAAIDALQMQRNKQLFEDYFVKKLNSTQLLDLFVKTFKHASADEVSFKLQRWLAAQP
jgi:hypothetical protein